MHWVVTRILLPVAILGLGVAAARGIMAMKPTAARSEPQPRIATVEVLEVQPQSLPARVYGSGLVSAAQEVVITPEVSGRIVSVSPHLMPGGRFKQGEVLARIDARQYELAMRQQKSAVQKARLDLQLEQGRGEVAEREWKLLGGEGPDVQGTLALRKPQLEAARVALEAAESGLEQARLNLDRTVLRAPFNATVVTENLDVGQVVGPTTQAIRLIGTDRFWVTVSVTMDDLSVIQVPGLTGDKGSQARIRQRVNETLALERQGQVRRLIGQLDAQTRRAQLVLSMDNPLDPTAGQLPILPGAYVEVEIEGRPLDQVFVVPRAAIFNGELVWRVTSENRLAASRVTQVWGEREQVFVQGDLRAGNQIVVSPLASPAEGLAVKPTMATAR